MMLEIIDQLTIEAPPTDGGVAKILSWIIGILFVFIIGLVAYFKNELNKENEELKTEANGWHTKVVEQSVSVANATSKPAKKKLEVITANYDLSNPKSISTLFD